MTPDKSNRITKAPDGKAWRNLHAALAWLCLLLVAPAQACMCASTLTVDDLLQAADAVAEVRVTREYQLKYLILQARCEADALCRDALARLGAPPANSSPRTLAQVRVEASLARLRVQAAGELPQGPPAPVASTHAWEAELASLEATSGAPTWDREQLPALQLQVLRWFKAPPRSSSAPASTKRSSTPWPSTPGPQQLAISTRSMCAAEPILAFDRSYVLPLRQRAVRGEAVSYEVSGCADSHALLRSGDALYRTRAQDGQATQPYGSYADFVRRYATPVPRKP